jgi:hypothetical protein
MLCQVCSRLDFDAASSGGAFHHDSYAKLLSAAEAGCPLCSTIQDQYSKRKLLRLDKYEPDDSQVICSFNQYGQFLSWDQYKQSIGGSNIAHINVQTKYCRFDHLLEETA